MISENQVFWSFLTKRQPKNVKTITSHSQSTILIFRTLKIYSSLDIIPLKRHYDRGLITKWGSIWSQQRKNTKIRIRSTYETHWKQKEIREGYTRGVPFLYFGIFFFGGGSGLCRLNNHGSMHSTQLTTIPTFAHTASTCYIPTYTIFFPVRYHKIIWEIFCRTWIPLYKHCKTKLRV